MSCLKILGTLEYLTSTSCIFQVFLILIYIYCLILFWTIAIWMQNEEMILMIRVEVCFSLPKSIEKEPCAICLSGNGACSLQKIKYAAFNFFPMSQSKQVI
ncbi:hypothetical protein BA6E_11132 [Bacteroidales bacterium 6E]|nr:hypothetical protein BA6E_11132 [Bacteroidales bacterium 6E]